MQVKVIKRFWDSAERRMRLPNQIVEIADADVKRWGLVESGKVEVVKPEPVRRTRKESAEE